MRKVDHYRRMAQDCLKRADQVSGESRLELLAMAAEWHGEFARIGADGLPLDRQGRVIIAAFAGRAPVRLEPNGRRTVLADSYEGKRCNGPNDVVVKRDGCIYFTDTYGGCDCATKTRARGLDYNAVFLWKNGRLTLLIKDMTATNGLAFSPDIRNHNQRRLISRLAMA